jgi:hypothetical protein
MVGRCFSFATRGPRDLGARAQVVQLDRVLTSRRRKLQKIVEKDLCNIIPGGDSASVTNEEA